MRTLRRLTAAPAPRLIARWRAELLTAAALAAGVAGQLTGAY